tara:strand:- start:663 stop:1115 length:453 start_codon:yes stop_codon:yes gene_type:complete
MDEKIIVNILYGCSCVGKSTTMEKANKNVNKVEMDDCKYWLFDEEQRSDICINYLIEQIILNLHNPDYPTKLDMIVTSGNLPLPNDNVYTQLEKQYSIKFIHTLVLVKNIEQYKSYINSRNRTNIMDTLLEQYKWRESTQDLYDEIIYNY